MAYQRCNACGGEYDEAGRDGILYFHACAPLPRLRVRRLDGTLATIAPADRLPTDTLIRAFTIPRPDHRDENTLRYDQVGTRAVRVLKSEGAGVTLIPDPR